MTKLQRLAELTARVITVAAVIQRAEIGPVRTYDCHVLTRLPNGTMTMEVQPLYVQNEGQQNEQADFAREEKGNAADEPAFLTKLRQGIAAREGTNGIKKIVVDTLDVMKAFAIVTVYSLTNATVSTSRRYVGLDANGQIELFTFTG